MIVSWKTSPTLSLLTIQSEPAYRQSGTLGLDISIYTDNQQKIPSCILSKQSNIWIENYTLRNEHRRIPVKKYNMFVFLVTHHYFSKINIVLHRVKKKEKN